MNYRKLYFSLNSPTCADVSGRIGSDLGEGGEQRLDHGEAQRVACRGGVERESRDAVGVVAADEG